MTLFDTIKKASDHNSFWKAVSSLFNFIEVAEEEIEYACKRISNPERSAELKAKSFQFLSPTKPISWVRDDKVYRHHCRELLERMTSDGSQFDFTEKTLRPATKAEMLGAVAQISLGTPLAHIYELTYVKLFQDVQGAELAEQFFGDDEYFKLSFVRHADEIEIVIEQLRRQLTPEKRSCHK